MASIEVNLEPYLNIPKLIIMKAVCKKSVLIYLIKSRGKCFNILFHVSSVTRYSENCVLWS